MGFFKRRQTAGVALAWASNVSCLVLEHLACRSVDHGQIAIVFYRRHYTAKKPAELQNSLA